MSEFINNLTLTRAFVGDVQVVRVGDYQVRACRKVGGRRESLIPEAAAEFYTLFVLDESDILWPVEDYDTRDEAEAAAINLASLEKIAWPTPDGGA